MSARIINGNDILGTALVWAKMANHGETTPAFVAEAIRFGVSAGVYDVHAANALHRTFLALYRIGVRR